MTYIKPEESFMRQHDHLSPTNDGCGFCLMVESLEALNPKYAGVPLAERRIRELRRKS